MTFAAKMEMLRCLRERAVQPSVVPAVRELPIKLTRPQLQELRRLGTGRQRTYGKVRARVQGNLWSPLGLARFVDENGNRVEYREIADYCEITERGRQVLAVGGVLR